MDRTNDRAEGKSRDAHEKHRQKQKREYEKPSLKKYAKLKRAISTTTI